MRSPLRFFTVDWAWKLIALGVALIVFFGIRKTVSYTQTMVLTVEAEAVDGVQALTGFKPEVVSVTFRGTEAAIRRLSIPGVEPPRIRLRLKQPPSGMGEMSVKILRRDVSHDDGLRIMDITPKVVQASFDTRDKREFEVADPIITGTPKGGVVQVSVEPKTVELTGSRILLDDLEAARTRLSTAILDVSNRTEGFQTVLKVLPPDNRGGWSLKPDTVRVDVRFERADVTQTFQDVPVEVVQAPSGKQYRVEPRTVGVTIRGTPQQVELAETRGVRVFVEEQRSQIPDAEGALLGSPIAVFAPTNSVNSVEIVPPRIRMIPVSQEERRQ